MLMSKLTVAAALVAAAACSFAELPALTAGDAASKRQQTPAGKLLNRLDELRPKFGEDEWAGILRDLIQLGPKAVPDLITELDTTNDERMLRCMGFVVRGIGDKRAIPALIRALPKTCVTSGSDYGLVAKDPELLAFMQKHDRDRQHNATHYGFGRAVNEISFTLQKLTGVKHGEEEIVHVSLQGSPRQQFLQRSLYQRFAERWAKWWEAHWQEHVSDERYARVNLAPLAQGPPMVIRFPQGPEAKFGGRHSGHILQSVRNPKAKYVFIDLDTGRECGLPKHLQAAPGQPERLDDIQAWAAREGLDLMGTEYQLPGNDKLHYVLRALGLAAWQIQTERYKTLEAELRDNRPLNMGTRTDGLLAHFDSAKGRYAPEETATFLFHTREGGYGAIFVGVEVHDNSLQPGGFASGDEEHNPVGFYKGRRFGYALITGSVEPNGTKKEPGLPKKSQVQATESAGEASRQFYLIKEEWHKLQEAFQKSLSEAKTDAEVQRIYKERRPDPKPYVGRLMKVFEAYPDTYGGIAALYWSVCEAETSEDAQTALVKLREGPIADADLGLLWSVFFFHSSHREGLFPEAMPALFARVSRELEHPKAPDLLIRVCQTLAASEASSQGSKVYRQAGDLLMSRFPDAKYLWRFCQVLQRGSDPARAETHLRTALEKNKISAVRVAASFALASILQNKNEASQAEAIQLYQRVIEEADDAVKDWNRLVIDPKRRESIQHFPGKDSWVPPAQMELDEIRARGLGKIAPDILGVDLDGKPMKLSDYRGKVVLLDFWGFW